MHTMFQDLEARRLMSSPHYVVGPTFTDNGTTLTATGSVAGLGNEDVTVTLDATGTAKIIGINPAGKRAPGQSKVVNVSGETTITDVKNGRVDFSVTTIEAKAPGGRYRSIASLPVNENGYFRQIVQLKKAYRYTFRLRLGGLTRIKRPTVVL